MFSSNQTDCATRTPVRGWSNSSAERQSVYSVTQAGLGYRGTRWGSLTPLQRCSQCILQPKPTGLPEHSLGESYPFAEMQSVYSATQADWATGALVGGVLPLCRDAVSVFCNPSRLGYRSTRWGSLTLCRDAVSVFCNPSRLGYRGTCWGESYPFAEMQSVYSATQAHWATGALFGGVLPLCRDAVVVFCNPSRLGTRKRGYMDNMNNTDLT